VEKLCSRRLNEFQAARFATGDAMDEYEHALLI
jgi:hypothetical protein